MKNCLCIARCYMDVIEFLYGVQYDDNYHVQHTLDSLGWESLGGQLHGLGSAAGGQRPHTAQQSGAVRRHASAADKEQNHYANGMLADVECHPGPQCLQVLMQRLAIYLCSSVPEQCNLLYGSSNSTIKSC